MLEGSLLFEMWCEPPPGRPALPARYDPHHDETLPGWLIDCADGLPFWINPSRRYDGFYEIWDIDDRMWVPHNGFRRRWNGVERAAALMQILACTQRRCAAAEANNWTEPQRDPDADGVQIRCDNCLAQPNADQRDADGDGVGDACDGCPADFDPFQTNIDGDRWGDVCDNCRSRPNDIQQDTDGDGVGDVCDVCRGVPDPSQLDADGDDVGDACDLCRWDFDPDQLDSDADGLGDACDVCPLDPDPDQRDTDADGQGDICDDDDDDDGLTDAEEEEIETDPLNPDTDEDGHDDGEDNCPLEPNEGQEETDDPSNGEGDACDLPLPPEEVHPDMPPSMDQLVWTDAVRVEAPQTVPWALLYLPIRLLAEAAASYGDGPQVINDPPDQPPAEQGDDQPPARRDHWHWVQEVVGLLVGELEDATGKTLGIVLGRAYEQWAGNTYCHSNAHALAFAEIGEDPDDACGREFVIPRTTHDFDNPQPLIGTMRRRLRSGEIREYRFERKRRHDCHCRGVAGVIAPLSEEYKASRTVSRQYRGRYHRWLVAQCRDYRFTLARLTRDALPHLGSIRDVYRRLLESRRIGRPALLYRLLRPTAAMQAVLDECRFAEFPDDAGIMPEVEVVRRRRARPEEPWSQMQSRVSAPLWESPPDAVQGCEGGLVQHYLAEGCPVQPGVQAPPGLGRCAPGERRWGIYTRCSPGFDVQDDPFVNPVWTDFDTGATRSAMKVLQEPVCPPRWMSIQSALIWEQMAGIDRLSSRVDAEGFREFFGHFRDLHGWGFPIWIGAEQNDDFVQVVQHGQWVITHEHVFMDFGFERMGPNGDPLSPIGAPPPLWDGVVGIPEDQVDPDEARDACFD